MKNIIIQNNGRGPWVVEFSQNQRKFYVQQLGSSLNVNFLRFTKAEPSDCVPIAVFDSQENATVFIDALNLRKDRDKPFSREELLIAEGLWRSSRAVLGQLQENLPKSLTE